MSESIGETLRQAREQQGRDLDEAARELRVQSHHLEALEGDRFHVLGGDVYAKGHLRTYARWLGIDPEPLIQRYRQEVEGGGYDPHVLAEHPVARRSRPQLPGWVAWGGIGVLVLVAALAVAGTFGPRAPDQAAGPDDDEAVVDEEPTPSVEDTPTAEPDPDPEPEPEPEGVNLVLIVEDRAWLRVSIEDQIVQEGTFESGDVLEFEHEEEIRVRLGNAGGVTMQLNDEVLGSPAGRGQVWEGTCTPDGCEQAA